MISVLKSNLLWFNQYSWASVFVNFVKITVTRIHKFMAIDPINTICYEKLLFNEH